MSTWPSHPIAEMGWCSQVCEQGYRMLQQMLLHHAKPPGLSSQIESMKSPQQRQDEQLKNAEIDDLEAIQCAICSENTTFFESINYQCDKRVIAAANQSQPRRAIRSACSSVRWKHGHALGQQLHIRVSELQRHGVLPCCVFLQHCVDEQCGHCHISVRCAWQLCCGCDGQQPFDRRRH